MREEWGKMTSEKRGDNQSADRRTGNYWTSPEQSKRKRTDSRNNRIDELVEVMQRVSRDIDSLKNGYGQH